ncbi:DUF4129 domain-containing protein [Paenibacillus doosanensis]|uniref:DUF4129 domain-containing protein n=1 Tax=Paenibacillus doosanensis TaxID=1229154 RepID=UPI0021806E0D|nr:DUF4129 domain-containing protein [Paenibacillus doosanensis]MCS7461962.1 DUF4129 domain-containing protein [Paenibacillus doosanensis]
MNINSKGRELGTVTLKGCIELLLALPPVLIAAVFLAPEAVRWAWLCTLPLGYAAGCALRLALPITRSYQLIFVSLLLAAAHCWLFFGDAYVSYALLPLGFIAVYRGIRLVTEPWRYFFPVSFYVIGMIVYFAAAIVVPFQPALAPYGTLLTCAGLVALAVTLLVSNESNMKQETLSGGKEPVIAKEMLWKNRLLIVLLMAVIMVVLLLRSLYHAFLWLKQQLLLLLAQLLSRDGEQAPAQQETAPKPPPADLGGAGEPAAWMVWLEKLMYYAVGAIVAIALLALVYLIVRRIPAVIRRLYAWLAARLQSREEGMSRIGYEDDVESLVDWDQWNGKLLSRWKRLFSGTDKAKWEELQDNAERVRYLYRSWLGHSIRRGYRFQKHLTPQETGREVEEWSGKPGSASSSLLALYERVRYGGKQAGDEEVLAAKTFADKK